MAGAAGFEPTMRESKSRALTDLAMPQSVKKNGSPDWTRTSDSLINSQVLYRLSYRGIFSGKYLLSRGVATQVPSAYECLTTVFGMGTGGTTQPSSPLREQFPENRTGKNTFGKKSQRHISIGQLNALPHLHSRPINLVIRKVS